ncbi:hypothetical protein EDM56_16915 [Brevibacillus fluminis]|uniref:Uncharacterized protein n=1 Tax=Brevibacillus fluminis TaxID=511487 RepID=A0A3M8DGY4_9BACL|nr:hypothetical protein [Brevibacillus fluminis]RNB87343.1 hypothetical protein EDM56_16915 [Brevibacillus fluminis]
MYNHYQSPGLTNEIQRLITQLQQNERNTANTLHAIANQLQTLAASENQSNAMLQQLYSLTAQLSFEASRHNQYQPMQQPSMPNYETVRSSVNPTVYANVNNANASYASSTPQGGNTAISHSLLQNQTTSSSNAAAQDSVLNQSFTQN